jgi:hypothetical protein
LNVSAAMMLEPSAMVATEAVRVSIKLVVPRLSPIV